MALDHLAIGARAGERGARAADRAELRGMAGLGAIELGELGRELAAATRDEALGERELACRSRRRSRRDRVRETCTSGLDACAQVSDTRGGIVRVADGGR